MWIVIKLLIIRLFVFGLQQYKFSFLCLKGVNLLIFETV